MELFLLHLADDFSTWAGGGGKGSSANSGLVAHSICTVDGMDTTTFKHKFLISHASTPEMDSGFNLNL